VKVLFFSDGHIGEYPEGNVDPVTGLNTRLQDTLRVWDWAHKVALERGVDLVIFAGDRFRTNRPPTWMRDMADALLSQFARSGIQIACLLGNHDVYDKSARWNSWNGVQVWGDCSTIHVFDRPGKQLRMQEVTFHFLPYGFKELGYEIEGRANVLVFHDDVRGVSSYGPVIAANGLDPAVVDRPGYLAVFGGHVHLRQELELQNTVGVHIGSPLERVQDGDQGPKGALLADIRDNDGLVSLEFIESPLPKIVRQTLEWDSDVEVASGQVAQYIGNVVCLAVTHNGSATPRWRRQLEDLLRTRGAASAKVDLRLIVSTESQPGAVPVVASTAQLADQLVDYVHSVHGDTLIPYIREVLEKSPLR
jgi:DNA repair exonuclease SbcCD nuclease subunit